MSLRLGLGAKADPRMESQAKVPWPGPKGPRKRTPHPPIKYRSKAVHVKLEKRAEEIGLLPAIGD